MGSSDSQIIYRKSNSRRTSTSCTGTNTLPGSKIFQHCSSTSTSTKVESGSATIASATSISNNHSTTTSAIVKCTASCLPSTRCRDLVQFSNSKMCETSSNWFSKYLLIASPLSSQLTPTTTSSLVATYRAQSVSKW